MNTKAGCTDGGKNLRGAEKTPSGRSRNGLPLTGRDVRCQDRQGRPGPTRTTSAKIAYDGGAAQLFGEDSWKWMLLQPSLADNQE